MEDIELKVKKIVAEQLGIKAVWNFAPVHLKVPKNVLVQNENMAYSLAVLSKHLIEKMGESQSTGGCT